MFNEIIYGFRFNDTLKTITDLPLENFDRFQFIYKKQIEKSIVWVNATTKHRYNQQHTFINFPVGSKAFFRLHHGYIIPGILNKELSQQRTGRFIKKKKGKLVYELNLPLVMTIHPVISIVQFEPAFKTPDPFGRPDDKEPPFIRTKNDDALEYKIKRLVKKRLVKNRL